MMTFLTECFDLTHKSQVISGGEEGGGRANYKI